jgi:undecaprenyl-diphosphatase
VAFLHLRCPAQIAWLKARFSPEGYLGLHLTVGALSLLATAWIFGSIAEDVVTRDPIVLLDQRVAEWFPKHGTPAFFRALSVITFVGSGLWLALATTAGAAILMWQRAWYRSLILVLTVPGGIALNLLLKTAFHRDRPLFEHPLLVLNSYSFPSGHTMGATLLYGLAAVLGFYWVRTWRGRVGIGAAAISAVFLVGLSRIALGVHFLSDVLGAVAAGLAWLAVCVTSVETLRRRRLARSGRTQ